MTFVGIVITALLGIVGLLLNTEGSKGNKGNFRAIFKKPTIGGWVVLILIISSVFVSIISENKARQDVRLRDSINNINIKRLQKPVGNLNIEYQLEIPANQPALKSYIQRISSLHLSENAILLSLYKDRMPQIKSHDEENLAEFVGYLGCEIVMDNKRSRNYFQNSILLMNFDTSFYKIKYRKLGHFLMDSGSDNLNKALFLTFVRNRNCLVIDVSGAAEITKSDIASLLDFPRKSLFVQLIPGNKVVDYKLTYLALTTDKGLKLSIDKFLLNDQQSNLKTYYSYISPNISFK
ncbi:MAG: hypothetical protein ACTHJ8_05815 [Mucilaginibacter sp.]